MTPPRSGARTSTAPKAPSALEHNPLPGRVTNVPPVATVTLLFLMALPLRHAPQNNVGLCCLFLNFL